MAVVPVGAHPMPRLAPYGDTGASVAFGGFGVELLRESTCVVRVGNVELAVHLAGAGGVEVRQWIGWNFGQADGDEFPQQRGVLGPLRPHQTAGNALERLAPVGQVTVSPHRIAS